MNSIDFRIFPTTRYQGSKRKLLSWIYKNIATLKFNSALDIFGGTASVSYLFKRMGKRVFYNDYLKFNYYCGKALIENKNILLEDSDIDFLLQKHRTITYNKFVQLTFKDMYYTDCENEWIDRFLSNWQNLSNIYPNKIAEYKKALAFTSFAQSALKKRPFNLFHRANLYLRLNDVKRSFGNKTSWEGSFDVYFRYFAREINKAIFDNNKDNLALNMSASDFREKRAYELIYIDPPYIRNGRSGSEVDYKKFYHFLEGACEPQTWDARINYDSDCFFLREEQINEWISISDNRNAFERLFAYFAKSIIVVSYKEPGIPTKRELIYSLKKYKKNVISIPGLKYDYALNRNNGFHKEYLLIGLNC